MTTRPIPPALSSTLEYAPLVGFLVAYLMFRDDTFMWGETEYTGFVAVSAMFIPVFLASIAALYLLTGRLTRIQVFGAGMLLVFGGLGVWLNDPRFLKIKPTVIYALLGLVLAVGLWRKTSVLKYIMEDTIPLKKRGWRVLTQRVMGLFFTSALANEVVWRTQPEATWVLFETLVMPLLIFGFFIAQIPLFVRYAAWKL